MKLNILIADDQKLFRNAVANLVRSFEDVLRVEEVSNGLELLDKLRLYQPDLILLDLEMPIIDGLEAAKRIRQNYRDLKILILTIHEEESFIIELLKAGANGFLIKDYTSPEELKRAIKTVIKNGFYFNDKVSHALLKEITSRQLINPKFNKSVTLKEIEIDILKLICKEYTSAQIADELCKSVRTIETYRKKLMDKVGAKSVVGLVIFAIQKGISF